MWFLANNDTVSNVEGFCSNHIMVEIDSKNNPSAYALTSKSSNEEI